MEGEGEWEGYVDQVMFGTKDRWVDGWRGEMRNPPGPTISHPSKIGRIWRDLERERENALLCCFFNPKIPSTFYPKCPPNPFLPSHPSSLPNKRRESDNPSPKEGMEDGMGHPSLHFSILPTKQGLKENRTNPDPPLFPISFSHMVRPLVHTLSDLVTGHLGSCRRC